MASVSILEVPTYIPRSAVVSLNGEEPMATPRHSVVEHNSNAFLTIAPDIQGPASPDDDQTADIQLPETFACDICGKAGFSNVRALAGHKSVHSRKISKPTESDSICEVPLPISDETLSCIVCGKTFTKRSRLEEHQNHHWKYPYYLEEETPTCKLCGEQLSKYGFHRHKCFLGIGDGIDGRITKTKNSKPEKIYKCEICEKSYALYKPFKAHMKSHNVSETPLEKTRYKCAICDKVFGKKFSYENHLLKHTGKRPYLCDHCGKSFKTKGDLTRHTAFHTGDRQHQCEICQKAFFCKWDLVEHRNIHTGEMPFQCEVCGKNFNRRRSLRAHHDIHVRKGEIVKPPSTATSNAKRKTDDGGSKVGPLKIKLKLSDVNKPQWECLNAEELENNDASAGSKRSSAVTATLTNRMGLFDAIRQTLSTSKEESNNMGSSSMYNDAQLLLDMRFGLKDGTNAAPEAAKGSEDSTAVSRNIFSTMATDYPAVALKSVDDKSEEKMKKRSSKKADWKTSIKCTYCDITFNDFDSIVVHLDEIHENEKLDDRNKWDNFRTAAEKVFTDSKRYNCEICGLSVGSGSSLRRHRKTHQKYGMDGTITCEHCKKVICKFKMSRHYCDAMKLKGISPPEKAHKCEECGKEYIKKSSLTNHMTLIHSTKPVEQFTCSECDKAFTRRYSYEKHMMTHSGERPFLCSHCGKSFITKGDLNRHYQFHVGERPHQCDRCDKAFTCKWDLEDHYSIHTGERKHICNVCGKGFGRKRSLRCHRKTHQGHNELSE